MMTKAKATKIAKATKKILEKNVGGRWKVRVHENIGWHYSLTFGTLCVSPNSYLKGYLVLNGATHCGTGNIGLNIYNPKNAKGLIKAILLSLDDQKKFVENYIYWYNKNSKLKPFKKLL